MNHFIIAKTTRGKYTGRLYTVTIRETYETEHRDKQRLDNVLKEDECVSNVYRTKKCNFQRCTKNNECLFSIKHAVKRINCIKYDCNLFASWQNLRELWKNRAVADVYWRIAVFICCYSMKFGEVNFKTNNTDEHWNSYVNIDIKILFLIIKLKFKDKFKELVWSICITLLLLWPSFFSRSC